MLVTLKSSGGAELCREEGGGSQDNTTLTGKVQSFHKPILSITDQATSWEDTQEVLTVAFFSPLGIGTSLK